MTDFNQKTHDTDVGSYSGQSRQMMDVDPDMGCKEFEIEKGRFSFRLTAPYRKERRRAASEAAKKRIKGV